ncbi:MAG TPA: M60 family metallopeptidase [Phycisphaerales bacterium]|nr:M60 family metallopeptidase [Phycisphaerales bacterium]
MISRRILLATRLLALAMVLRPGPLLAAPPPPAPDQPADPIAEQIAQAKAYREAWLKLAPEDVRAHPDAPRFPGAVPAEAPRRANIEVPVPLDPIRWRPKARWWQSTGLYAAPGEVVTVDVPEDARAVGLYVRIGAHQDNSNPKAKKFKRTPVNLTRSWPLDRAQVRIASPFGGPVYIEVPPPDARHAARAVAVRVSGAIAAPLFVLGQTTPEQWAAARTAPGPWAELVAPHISITVPSRLVREIDNPTDLMTFWERGLELVHELGAGEFTAERLVWDPAISAGSMHSGHPIMCQGGLDSIVDLKKLRDGNVWGFFHEMGHNQQYNGWTPKGQTEVTCNWFPMYVRSKGLGLPPFDRAENWTKPDAPMPRGEGQSPFVALRLWRQIQEEFGWEPFKAVLKEIHSPEYRTPKTNQAKWDDLLLRFSRATNRDLSPQFTAWGAEVSEQGLQRAAAAGWPTWAHKDAPGR